MSALSGNPVSTVRLPAAAAVAAAVAAVAAAVAAVAAAVAAAVEVEAVAAATASNPKGLPFAILYRYFITCRTCHRQIFADVRK